MGATTTTYTNTERRLLNVLAADNVPQLGLPVRQALTAANADHTNVVSLADVELIEAFHQGREHIEFNSVTMFELGRDGNTLRLTGKGISWVVTDPENKLLRAIDAARSGSYDLRAASRDCDDDALIISVVENGYATLHYKGDLKETKFVRGIGGRLAHQFVHGADYVLIPTTKMRRVLGPEKATS